MSADNWAECPRCRNRLDKEIKQLRTNANDAYGVVDLEQWQHLDQLAIDAVNRDIGSTLREDYEISGAKEGCVTVSYSGHCQACSLSLKFTHEAHFEGLDL